MQVRVAESYERFWGRTAAAGLCVTRAMQLELRQHWRVPATVFYDRPPDFFRPASLAEQHGLMQRLQPALAEGLHPYDFCAALSTDLGPGQTVRTEGGPASPAATTSGKGTSSSAVIKAAGAPRLRPGRPALVVSSTSWTPDEDFGLLLRAAELYDAKARRWVCGCWLGGLVATRWLQEVHEWCGGHRWAPSAPTSSASRTST